MCTDIFYLDETDRTCARRTNTTCETYEVYSDHCETCNQDKYLDLEASFTCRARTRHPNCSVLDP